MALFTAFLGLTQSYSSKNNMTDDTQMDPIVGGEEETPIAPAGEGMEEAPSEAAPEAGEEAAA